MAKSFKVPNKKSGFVNEVMKAVPEILNSVDSIVNIIQTIGEERRKSEELKLEGIKVHAEIRDRINERENETVRVLKQYEIELKKIDAQMKDNDQNHKQKMARHDERMKQLDTDFQDKMRKWDIIEKIVDTALDQYRFYRNDIDVVYRNTYEIDTNLLNLMNNTIQQLSLTLVQANNSRLINLDGGE